MFKGQANFSHSSKLKVGVLITNLGTPEAPTKSALKKYLKQFLSDKRVVEVPRFIWWFILNLIILNIRPAKSAKAYQSIWSEEGSPLMVHTKNQSLFLNKLLCEKWGDNIVVDFAMRYGEPSITNVIEKMQQQGVNKLLVLPLYPQYSAATSASTFDAVAEDFIKRRWLPDFRFISHYHDHPDYIQAIVNQIKRHWLQHGQAQKLLFSYHGVPQRYLDNGDPYFCECHKTSRLVAAGLGLSSDQYMTTFQSRFGKEEWVKPYTDATLKSLPKQGVESVQVICPGFSSDCLETIEEIAQENKEYFLHSGGKQYQYIPALNSDPEHIQFLAKLVEQNLQGWVIDSGQGDRLKHAELKGAK